MGIAHSSSIDLALAKEALGSKFTNEMEVKYNEIIQTNGRVTISDFRTYFRDTFDEIAIQMMEGTFMRQLHTEDTRSAVDSVCSGRSRAVVLKLDENIKLEVTSIIHLDSQDVFKEINDALPDMECRLVVLLHQLPAVHGENNMQVVCLSWYVCMIECF